MRIRHHHVRTGPPFFDQRDVVASDVPHDEIVGGALVAARREIRVVAVGAGEFPEGTVFDGVDGGPIPHGQRRIHIRRVPDRARAHRAHAGELLRLFRTVDVVLNVQRQPGPCLKRCLKFFRVTKPVIDSLGVKPGFLPARNLPPVIGVHRRFRDVRRPDVQEPVLVGFPL